MNAESTTPVSQPLDAWFLDLLACPGCDQHLPLHPGEGDNTLICQCGRYAFPIRDGIPILLVEEATIINPDLSPDAPVASSLDSSIESMATNSAPSGQSLDTTMNTSSNISSNISSDHTDK